MTRVLIIDPQFTEAEGPTIERAVLPADATIEVWRPAGHEIVPVEVLETADAVINCRSRHVLPATTIARMGRARIVVQAGVGFNHVDLEAAGRAGIPVCNTPDYGTMEVADHAIALMLTLARGTATYDGRLRHGNETWSTFALPLPPVRRLSGLAFGVVGLGRIGLAASLRAKAFGMSLAFFDPYQPPGYERALGYARHATLESLMGAADVVSVHCPLTPETEGLIGAGAFAAAKPGLVLINTARGPIVDLDALTTALLDTRVVAAGLDVLPKEPPDRAHPLIAAWARREPWLDGRLVITPHAAFYTPESLADMRRLSALAVAEFLRDGTLRACVNGAFLKRA
jgi:lactate dehydrogenase-like 2-hydroxyacid dehydrogenase